MVEPSICVNCDKKFWPNERVPQKILVCRDCRRNWINIKRVMNK